MNIYIVRHGQTHNNAKGEYYGKLDVSLNQEGVKQVQKLGASLKTVTFDYVYSSAATRALESLKLCGESVYTKVHTDPRLSEIDFGDFEGLTYKEICTRFPECVAEWEKDWQNFCPPKGEAFTTFYARVSDFLKELLEKEASNVLIMTHSGVIKAMYCYVMKNNPDLYWNFTCHNGKINIIKYEYGNLFIDAMNKGGV